MFRSTELPDLVIDTDALEEEMRVDFQHINYLQCAYEENCLAKGADALFRYVHHLHISLKLNVLGCEGFTVFRYSFLRAIPEIFKRHFSRLSFVEST